MSETIESSRHFREPRGILMLWFAVLAAPTAWMAGLGLEYGLVRVACAGGGMVPLHLISLATLLLALAGGLVALREWRRAGGEWPGEGHGAESRSRFMAALGMLATPLFALLILAQWIALLTFNPCMGI